MRNLFAATFALTLLAIVAVATAPVERGIWRGDVIAISWDKPSAESDCVSSDIENSRDEIVRAQSGLEARVKQCQQVSP